MIHCRERADGAGRAVRRHRGREKIVAAVVNLRRPGDERPAGNRRDCRQIVVPAPVGDFHRGAPGARRVPPPDEYAVAVGPVPFDPRGPDRPVVRGGKRGPVAGHVPRADALARDLAGDLRRRQVASPDFLETLLTPSRRCGAKKKNDGAFHGALIINGSTRRDLLAPGTRSSQLLARMRPNASFTASPSRSDKRPSLRTSRASSRVKSLKRTLQGTLRRLPAVPGLAARRGGPAPPLC